MADTEVELGRIERAVPVGILAEIHQAVAVVIDEQQIREREIPVDEHRGEAGRPRRIRRVLPSVACIEVDEDTETSGTMRWSIYSDVIEGEHFQRILPVMLPAINEASMHKLSELIGGIECTVESFFD